MLCNNDYRLKPDTLLDRYISLSPDLASQMAYMMINSLENSETKKWYDLASGNDDIAQLKEKILSLDNQLKTLDNKMVEYQFDNFENTTHYSLVGKAIPSALSSMFKVYSPISVKEYNKILLQTSISPVEYLTDKYESINELFHVEKQIRLNDFMAVYNAIEKTRRWDDYRELSKMAENHYPGTMLATYFEARYEEETGNPRKAMRTYQKAYGQEKIAFLDTDFMLAKADAIKKDFGY